MAQHTIRISQQNLRKSPQATAEYLLNCKHFDISLIQEPYTRHSDTIYGFPINSKLLYHQSQQYTPKTCILVSNSRLYVQLLPEFSTKNFTTIKIQLHSLSIIVVNTYLEPDSITQAHIHWINNLLLNFDNQPVIISGDMNARHSLWNDTTNNRHGNMLAELISDWNLTIHNNSGATCVTPSGNSIIDLTLTNNAATRWIHNWNTQTQSSSIFDHKQIKFCIVSPQAIPTRLNNSTSKFNEAKANWSIFKEHFNTQEFQQFNQSLDDINNPEDLDKTVLQLTRFIQEGAYKSMPTKKYSQRQHRTPWWDDELRLMQISTKNLRNLFFHEKDNAKKQIRKQQYNAYRNRYIRTINKKKAASWRSFLEESTSDNAWGNTYKMIKNKTKPKSFDLPILDNSPPTKHPDIIIGLVNDLFPTDPTQELPYPPHSQAQENYWITPSNIISMIESTNNKKAPGNDHITNNMLKQIKHELSRPLSTIFNKIITLGYYPRNWKNSVISVFPKPNKEDLLNPNNYRPISLISSLSKLLEKFIQTTLQKFIETNNLLNSNQHGFTKHRSTTTALTNITKDILDNKKQHPTSILAIDYSKAFDHANWNIIIKNLSQANFPLSIINVIRSYLTDRSVTFHYNQHKHTQSTNKGCPQGSPLSPTLWNIIINTLLNSFSVHGAYVHAYADDLNIVCTGNNLKELQTCLQNSLDFVHNWSQANHLTINAQKTQILHFHNKTLSGPVKLNNNIIDIVPKIKLLGVTLSNHPFKSRLNFNAHIDSIVKKITKTKIVLLSFCKNTYGINHKKRRTLYTGLIRPAIVYGSEIWSDHITASHSNKLESLQHSILKNIIGAYRTTSRQCAAILTNIEPVMTYIKSRQLKFKVSQGLITLPPCTTLENQIEQYRNQAMTKAFKETNDNFRKFFTTQIIPKHVVSNFYTTQFLTGHGHFRSYLFRFNLTNTEHCTCCATSQTPEHLLLGCPEYAQIKRELKVDRIKHLHEYTANQHNFNKLQILCKHIYIDLKRRYL